MPEFLFTALNREGREISDHMIADSEEALSRHLKKQRLVLIKARISRVKRLPLDAVQELITELSDLIESGVVLERALQVIGEDTGEAKVSKLANRLRGELKSGHSLSQAFALAGESDPLLVPLIHAGEASGKLALFLNNLNQHYQDQQSLKMEIRASLAYPMVLVGVSILSIIGLGIYVIPVFKDLFSDNPAALPQGTRIIFMLSDWLVAYGWTVPAITLAVAIGGGLALRNSASLRLALDGLLLRLPLAGRVILLQETAKLTGVLGTLLESGIPLVQAIETARMTMRNRQFRTGMDAIARDLRRGRHLSEAQQHLPWVPTSASRLLRIGEESGNLAKSALKANAIMERELRHRLKSLVSMLEPAIILSMGLVVGFVVVSMLLAVFSMSDLS